jgi:hypothetical protein
MRLWLAVVGLALCPGLAGAADDRTALEAEHVRLSEEMRMLASRNAWRGVEDSYQKLEALAERGVALTVDDVWYGAQAARSLGDLGTAYARLKTAQSIGTNEAIDQWVADIEASYGSVELSVDERYGESFELTPAQMPFDPEGRGAIEAAQRSIAETRAYEGLLPIGRYELGDRSFEVGTDGSVASIALVGRGASTPDQSVAAAVGPRATLGVGITDVGDSTAESLQPRGFLGGSLRLGVGVEVELANDLGWFVEAGYHGTIATPKGEDGEPLADRDSIGVEPNVLHLGYGWTGIVVRASELALSIGPTIAVGGGSVTGVSDGCTTDCAGLGDADPSALEYQRLSGTVRAAGGSASALWPFMKVGRMAGGLDLSGGAYYDGARTYPWAMVGYAIAPASRGR